MIKKTTITTILEEFEKEFPIYHDYCDDCWYSCPLAEGGCCDDKVPKDKCNCGAEKEHIKFKDFITNALKLYSEAVMVEKTKVGNYEMSYPELYNHRTDYNQAIKDIEEKKKEFWEIK